jgi:hypothetical protein
MPGFIPGIHDLTTALQEVVDARHRAGHDVRRFRSNAGERAAPPRAAPYPGRKAVRPPGSTTVSTGAP